MADIEECIMNSENVKDSPENQKEIYLLTDFHDVHRIQKLNTIKPKSRIYGLPALLQCMLDLKRWSRGRPVYNFAMLDVIVCFTGFRERDFLNNLAVKIRWMGGSVRRNLDADVTHLVAYQCAGSKVSRAAESSSAVLVMQKEWIQEAWTRRSERPSLSATDPSFMNKYIAKVFQECYLAFVGFTHGGEVLTELCSQTAKHHGVAVEHLKDPRITHVIVTDASSQSCHATLSEQLKTFLLPMDDKEAPDTEAPEEAKVDLDTSQVCQQANNTSLFSPIDASKRFSLPNESVEIKEKRDGKLIRCGHYRVPVLKLEWFWRSLQQTCLCPTEEYIYVPPSAADEDDDSEEELTDQACLKATPKSLERISYAKRQVSSPLNLFNAEDKRHSTTLNDSLTTSSPIPLTNNDATYPGDLVLNNSSMMCSSMQESTDKKLRHQLSSLQQSFRRSAGSAPGSANTSGCQPLSVGGGPPAAQQTTTSNEDLLAQLADPLSFPSNRERRQRLRQMHESASVETGSCVQQLGGGDAPNGNESGLSLKASRSMDKVIEEDHTSITNEQGATVSEGTVTPDKASQDVKASNLNGLVHSKRKSTNRLSLMHPGQSRKAMRSISDAFLGSSCLKTPDPNDGTPDGEDAPFSHISYTSPRLDLSNHSHSSIFRRTPSSTDRTPLKVKLEKRQHRVFEFFLTENNYYDILHYLTQVVYFQVTDPSQIGGAILPKKEADIVFSKLFPVHELHSRLHEQLNELENNWSMEKSCLSEVLIPHMGEMDKVYGHYMEFYSATHLRHLGSQYPRFLAFMRQIEKRKESGRQSLNDLLIRPVQRLPSISLLLEGIAKFTPPTHADYKGVKQVGQKVTDILEKINERLKLNEERLSLHCLFSDINGAPPEMISSSRSLVAQLEAFEIVEHGNGNAQLSPVTMFLLSDSIEIARPRRRHTGEVVSHAIKAAVVAIHGSDNGDPSTHDQVDGSVSTGVSHSNSFGKAVTNQSNALSANSSSSANTPGTGTMSEFNSLLSRKGSGASNSSGVAANLSTGFGLHTDPKQRRSYKHVRFVQLQHVKRVIDLRCEGQPCAAFALVVCASSSVNESVLGYCLAAGVTANFAKQTGKCPGPVENAVLACQASTSSIHLDVTSSKVSLSGVGVSCSDSVATLQNCVEEVKKTFLQKLCHQMIQVSCLATSPEDLLVGFNFDMVYSYSLESLLNTASNGFKSKKFRRQVGRNISMKTPRRNLFHSQSNQNERITSINSTTSLSNVHTMDGRNVDPISGGLCTPRRSVLSSILSLTQNPTGQTPTISVNQSGSHVNIADQERYRNCETDSTVEDIHCLLDDQFLEGNDVSRPSTPQFHRRTEQQVFHAKDPYMDDQFADEHNLDCISITSSNVGPSMWPAYAFKAKSFRCGPSATTSSTSLRSMPAKTKSKSSLIGRSSAGVFTRKSVCQSVLAGLKNIRKSIAGGGASVNGPVKYNEKNVKLRSDPNGAPLAEVEDMAADLSSNNLNDDQHETLEEDEFLSMNVHDRYGTRKSFVASSSCIPSQVLIHNNSSKFGRMKGHGSTPSLFKKLNSKCQSVENLMGESGVSASNPSIHQRRPVLGKSKSTWRGNTNLLSSQEASQSTSSLLNIFSAFKRQGRSHIHLGEEDCHSLHLNENGYAMPDATVSLSKISTGDFNDLPRRTSLSSLTNKQQKAKYATMFHLGKTKTKNSKHWMMKSKDKENDLPQKQQASTTKSSSIGMRRDSIMRRSLFFN